MPCLLSILKDRNCKSQINERSLKKYFSAAVSPSLIARTARKVGKQRRCRFNPVSFITSIIVQTCSGAKFTITSICSSYAALSGQSMEVKPFHNKIKRPAVTELTSMLLKRNADLLSAKFVKPKQGSLLLNILQEHGLAIEDIEAIDGSFWHVNDKLADIFPGALTAVKGEELRDTYDEKR